MWLWDICFKLRGNFILLFGCIWEHFQIGVGNKSMKTTSLGVQNTPKWQKNAKINPRKQAKCTAHTARNKLNYYSSNIYFRSDNTLKQCCALKMFLTHHWPVNPHLMETGQTSLAYVWRWNLSLFACQCRSSGRSTTWALRWWSQATPWCRHGLTWPSWFTLWTAAARTRSDRHTASERPPFPSDLHHWPTGVFSSAYLTSDGVNLSFDTLVTEVFQASSNQGIMGQ